MAQLVPYVVERSGREERVFDIYSRLLKDRIVFLQGAIDDNSANLIVAQMLFLQFDDLAVRHRVQAIKTIGDGYMAIAGILEGGPANAAAMAEVGLSMLDITDAISKDLDARLLLRIGIHTGGPIVAGVLGIRKIAYDVWGDAVNTAKRMETYGLPGRVHVSAATRQALGDAFHFEPRGVMEVKGKGKMETYFLCPVR